MPAETMSLESLGTAALALLGYIAALFLLSRVLPGKRAPGAIIEVGEQQEYVLNGLSIFLTVLAITALAEYLGVPLLSWTNAHFWALFAVANVFAFSLTVLLFLRGRKKIGQTSSGIVSSIKDMVYGIELNPKWWRVDLKLFSYRPSLIGLALINMSFAAVQYRTYGQLSDAMLLYQVFTLIYVLNYFQFEYGMLHTWDMIAERFGWMLVWGDYVLVPFFYSLPAWFLIDRTEPMSPLFVTALIVLFSFGFWLFRGANEQKHRFKRSPSARIWGRPPQTIGGRLLISGFWGIGRHLNYTGEICIYLAFTLTTGTESLIPYLLPLWLGCLLAHRAWRDETRCREKYGEAWTRYTQTARFRMIPFVY